MDLQPYTLEQIFLAAIKSEIESKKVYEDLANMVRNVFLKEKLLFLAGEEDKHEMFLEAKFKELFPNKELIIPHKSPVPLPDILIPNEKIPHSDVIQSAMGAELAAREFYLAMKDLFDSQSEIRSTLEYFANMELGHYQLLSIERDNILKFEDYDTYWEMMNIGP